MLELVFRKEECYMSPSLQILSLAEQLSAQQAEDAKALFLSQIEKQPPLEKDLLPKEGDPLPDRTFCLTYLRSDGSPSFCDCDKSKEFLGLGLHVCKPAETCVVRVLLYPHKFGGKRRN